MLITEVPADTVNAGGPPSVRELSNHPAGDVVDR